MKISLCIPTNGIIEWIQPVIESIYNQSVSTDVFEVVIVDNGNDDRFKSFMENLLAQHENLRYKRVKCSIFLNEIIAYKMAEGDFIKFINHRTVLLQGSLQKWIDFMNIHCEDQPVVYFSNGALNRYYDVYKYDTFDEFICNLGYWSSWSTGMALWKKDIDEIKKIDNVNELFPHTSVLFKNTLGREYIIDNTLYLNELKHTSQKKGSYDLFYAFAVEYPSLLLDLYKKGDISLHTFLKVKDELASFIVNLYEAFVIGRAECSYELDSFDDVINVFFSTDIFESVKNNRLSKFEQEWNLRKNSAINSENMIVIFGAGIKGREYAQKVENEIILCFIDNNREIQGDLIMGIPVLSLESYLEKREKETVVVCAGSYSVSQIEKQLKKYGLDYCVNN